MKYIGAYAAELDGLDALVFTGGIGENVATIRSEVCASLGYLGIRLSPARNRENAHIITVEDAPVKVMVVPTNEELMIARETVRVMREPAAEVAPAALR